MYSTVNCVAGAAIQENTASRRFEMEIAMCAEYDVKLWGDTGFQVICKKGHKATLKCHSKRKDCPDYKPSVGYTLEEVERRLKR